MVKTEFVKKIAEKAGMSKDESALFYKAFVETVTEALQAGDKVQLPGFGTFEVGVRSAREGRNPQTGETIQIAEAKTPKFKAGKALKDAVNG